MTTVMSTAMPTALPTQADHHPVRTAVRSTGVLLASLGLTIVVLVALATVVDSWA